MQSAIVVLTVLLPLGWCVNGAEVAEAKMPVIVLKLDDITRNGAPKDGAISPRWQKCVDFLEKEGVKASFGIIGSSLEEDAPAYFAWIKNLHQKGNIEFWNHGCKSRKGELDPAEFESASADEQQAALEKTQKLAQEKLGIELKAFGPHWSGTNENTEKALEKIPAIRTWFFGPAKPTISTKVMLERIVNLEQPTMVPNFEQLKERFEKFGRQKEYLVLQGHPNGWTDERFEAFSKAVKYLKEQGCTFMTVSELVASRVRMEKKRRSGGRRMRNGLVTRFEGRSYL